MTLADTVKQDLATAMKAGERDRVGTLRMVLSELQKAVKDNGPDELAVLRRERKRRAESATAFRDNGRPELADAEDAEALIIEAYLPTQLSDDEVRAIVRDAIAETGATTMRDMGAVMAIATDRAQGRAEGRRLAGTVKAALAS